MTNKAPRVLVLDGMWNKTLSAVRSLGEHGYDVTVGESTRLSTALFSRYARRVVVYPSPITESAAFMEWLIGEISDKSYDMVYPSELATQMLIGSRRAEVERYAAFPFADNKLTDYVHDKGRLMAFAAERGYDTPKTMATCEGGDIRADAAHMAPFLTFPAVIKPRTSSGSRGIVYVKDRADFVSALSAVHERYPYPIVQEYVESASCGYGVGALMNFDSEPRAAFVYKWIREWPVTGGPSTMRESVRWDELRDTATALLKELGWVGLAMVEFRVDRRDGKAKLLEINPRPWGSMNLARLSGIDFPCMLHRMAVDGDVDPRMDYRVGVRSRWLLPGEMMHLLSAPNKVKTFFEMLKPADGDDVFSVTDPMPALGRVFSILPFFYKSEMRRIMARRF